MGRKSFVVLIVVLVLSGLGLIATGAAVNMRGGTIADSERFINVLKEENMAAWIHGHIHSDHDLPNTGVDRWGTTFIDDGSIAASDEVESLLLIFENGSENVTVKSRDHLAQKWNELEDKFSFKLDHPFQWNRENLRIWVFSDIQPVTSEGWKNLERAVNDAKTNMGRIDMAFVLGDIVDHGTKDDYIKYRNYIDNYVIPWDNFYHLAGNHDFYPFFYGDHSNYQDIIDNRLRYTLKRGNILFILMSDNRPGAQGYYYDETFQWWKSLVENNRDINIITLIHHPLNGTTRGSTMSIMNILLDMPPIIVYTFIGLIVLIGISGGIAFEVS